MTNPKLRRMLAALLNRRRAAPDPSGCPRLQCLRDALPEFAVDFRVKDGAEWAAIRHPEHDESIRVTYDPNDPEPYLLRFATQHLHLEDEMDMLASARAFAHAEWAAIEFYRDGERRFGGQIETSLLEGLTYDSLRAAFGYGRVDISDMTFRVYAWDERYCFEGSFRRNEDGAVGIVREG